MKKVGLVGWECEDIVCYLGTLLASAGKRAAIVDCTEEEEVLSGSLSYETEGGREGLLGEIPVARERVDPKEEYEVTFYVFGRRMGHPGLSECELLLLVTDMTVAHAVMLRQVSEWCGQRALLLRNVIELPYDETYLVQATGQEFAQVCLFPLSERDLRERCLLQTEGKARPRRLSLGMRAALNAVLDLVEPGWRERAPRRLRAGVGKVAVE